MIGLPDAGITAALRERGVGEDCIAKWLTTTTASTTVPSPLQPSDVRKVSKCRVPRETAVAPPCTSQARHRSEASVQRQALRYLKATGWACWRVGQRNAKGTQDAGVSDLICAHPVHGVWFIEVKRPQGGRQSDAQRDFQAAIEAAGGHYALVTGLHDVARIDPTCNIRDD